MPSLTSLPIELLHHIISYLQRPPSNITSKPHQLWGGHLSNHHRSTLQNRNAIRSLILTNRHLYSILYPKLNPFIQISNPASVAKLQESINLNPRLGNSIKSAHISSASPYYVIFLFFLPTIRSMHLSSWNDSYPFYASESLNSTSPIESLYLSKCGAHEAALSQILRWPKALKEFWYEANHGEWEGHFEGQEADGFTCSAITRAIQPLKSTLEIFVFTRRDPGREGFFYNEGIDLTGFEELREIKTFHCLLVGRASEADVWKCMPASLKSLEVWYSDEMYASFLRDEVRPNWLFGVLGNKREAFPGLGRVRVVSLEWFFKDEEEEEEEHETDSESDSGGNLTRRMTVMLMELNQAFEDAGVSYSIYFNGHKWFKEVVEGGSTFEEDWDEKEIENPWNAF